MDKARTITSRAFQKDIKYVSGTGLEGSGRGVEIAQGERVDATVADGENQAAQRQVIIIIIQMTPLILIITLLPLASAYSTLLTISNASASISNYYQDFASCSCDLTPGLCDNYCCCDPQCVHYLPLRLQLAHGWHPICALPLPLPSKYPVDSHREVSDLSLIWLASSTLIGGLLATTTSRRWPPPSHTPLPTCCKLSIMQRQPDTRLAISHSDFPSRLPVPRHAVYCQQPVLNDVKYILSLHSFARTRRGLHSRTAQFHN